MVDTAGAATTAAMAAEAAAMAAEAAAMAAEAAAMAAEAAAMAAEAAAMAAEAAAIVMNMVANNVMAVAMVEVEEEALEAIDPTEAKRDLVETEGVVGMAPAAQTMATSRHTVFKARWLSIF